MSERRDGMRKLKSGMWEIEICHRRLRNGRLCVSSRTSDIRKARKYKRDLLAAIDQGEDALIEALRSGNLTPAELSDAMTNQTLDALRTRFIETRAPTTVRHVTEIAVVAGHGRAQRTEQSLQSLVSSMEREGLVDLPIAEVGPKRARAFLTGEKESNGGDAWSAATQRLHRRTLIHHWDEIIEMEADAAEAEGRQVRYRKNPWRKVRAPKPTKEPPDILDYQQWQALSERNAAHSVAALFGVCCLSGLRQQEAANLRTASDLDFDTNEIVVTIHREDDPGGPWVPWKPKTANSVRRVPMVPQLRTILERHIETGLSGRYLLRSTYADAPLSMTTCRQWAREGFQRARLPYGRRPKHLTLHSLRHTYGSWLLRENVPVNVVAELMGNTPTMVLKHYSNIFAHDRTAAAVRLAARLEGIAAGMSGVSSGDSSDGPEKNVEI